ncbi:unnamed protein product [Amoebophrya sp. A25]|nr:unnamed protein product [Amoebophrya sp. A25]|eukprot:GSA25T00024900001.1
MDAEAWHPREGELSMERLATGFLRTKAVDLDKYHDFFTGREHEWPEGCQDLEHVADRRTLTSGCGLVAIVRQPDWEDHEIEDRIYSVAETELEAAVSVIISKKRSFDDAGSRGCNDLAKNEFALEDMSRKAAAIFCEEIQKMAGSQARYLAVENNAAWQQRLQARKFLSEDEEDGSLMFFRLVKNLPQQDDQEDELPPTKRTRQRQIKNSNRKNANAKGRQGETFDEYRPHAATLPAVEAQALLRLMLREDALRSGAFPGDPGTRAMLLHNALENVANTIMSYRHKLPCWDTPESLGGPPRLRNCTFFHNQFETRYVAAGEFAFQQLACVLRTFLDLDRHVHTKVNYRKIEPSPEEMAIQDETSSEDSYGDYYSSSDEEDKDHLSSDDKDATGRKEKRAEIATSAAAKQRVNLEDETKKKNIDGSLAATDGDVVGKEQVVSTMTVYDTRDLDGWLAYGVDFGALGSGVELPDDTDRCEDWFCLSGRDMFERMVHARGKWRSSLSSLEKDTLRCFVANSVALPGLLLCDALLTITEERSSSAAAYNYTMRMGLGVASTIGGLQRTRIEEPDDWDYGSRRLVLHSYRKERNAEKVLNKTSVENLHVHLRDMLSRYFCPSDEEEDRNPVAGAHLLCDKRAKTTTEQGQIDHESKEHDHASLLELVKTGAAQILLSVKEKRLPTCPIAYAAKAVLANKNFSSPALCMLRANRTPSNANSDKKNLAESHPQVNEELKLENKKDHDDDQAVGWKTGKGDEVATRASARSGAEPAEACQIVFVLVDWAQALKSWCEKTDTYFDWGRDAY